MINLEVRRQWETKNSITGQMLLNGLLECYTLEPSRTTPVHPGHPAIPAGTYKVILTESPHLGYVTPEILDVPNRTAIRIHIANYPGDLLGCTAVGQTLGVDFVGQSKLAFEALMPKLYAQEITITYTEQVK